MKNYFRYKLDWILKNELAISNAPNTMDTLNKIKQEGIKGILTLCSEKEMILNEQLKENFQWERIVLPDHKKGIAPKIKEIVECIRTINRLMQYGPVLVHCKAGIERSPIICISYLIYKKNMSTQDALIYLMQQHPGTSPLGYQISLIKEFEKMNSEDSRMI